MQYVNIPKERIAVLIGSNGKAKKELEKVTRTKIVLDGSSVQIDGDPVDEWVAKDVVKAIGRGFSPEKALLLISDEMVLEIIDITDIVGDSPKSMLRVKGRIIGERGKSRRVIEEVSNTYVSVYGKTVSIIGAYDEVAAARDAVLKLISGSRHSSVYKFLEMSKKGKIQ
ncbi:MAG: KH domain-containing protein [Candidatus Altiarchaeota archaeon]